MSPNRDRGGVNWEGGGRGIAWDVREPHEPQQRQRRGKLGGGREGSVRAA